MNLGIFLDDRRFFAEVPGARADRSWDAPPGKRDLYGSGPTASATCVRLGSSLSREGEDRRGAATMSLRAGTELLIADAEQPMTGSTPPDRRCAPPAARTEGSGSGGRLRLLVVDDHAPCAESLAVLLRLWGAEVRVCGSGPQAIDLALSFRPDAALVDIMLPGIDGYELAAHLRTHDSMKNMMLIAVTGLGDIGHRVRTREAGFAYHLLKPLIHEELREALGVLLRNKGGT
jgi:CheY-like chemotaxis protein